MNFLEAVAELKPGVRIRRDNWDAPYHIYYDADENELRTIQDERLYLSQEDVAKNDWEAIDVPVIVRHDCSFQEAMAAAADGKAVRRRSWAVDVFMTANDKGEMCTCDDERYTFTVSDIKAQDWETA